MNRTWGHLPHVHLGLLEHGLQDHRDVDNRKDLLHKTLLNPVQREDLKTFPRSRHSCPAPPQPPRPHLEDGTRPVPPSQSLPEDMSTTMHESLRLVGRRSLGSQDSRRL